MLKQPLRVNPVLHRWPLLAVAVVARALDDFA